MEEGAWENGPWFTLLSTQVTCGLYSLYIIIYIYIHIYLWFLSSVLVNTKPPINKNIFSLAFYLFGILCARICKINLWQPYSLNSNIITFFVYLLLLTRSFSIWEPVKPPMTPRTALKQSHLQSHSRHVDLDSTSKTPARPFNHQGFTKHQKTTIQSIDQVKNVKSPTKRN